MGDGKPVVFLHGFMGTACDWRFNLPELSDEFAVKAFDLPGFGYSDKPRSFAYTSEGYADFLKAFLNVRQVEKCILVGNSMGGQIALETCIKYPERVSGLVLVDSGGLPGSVKLGLFRLLGMPVIGQLPGYFICRPLVRYVLSSILKRKSTVTSEVVDYYYGVYKTANSRKIPSLVVKKMMADEATIQAQLGRIKCPVLIIWGEQDKVIPPVYAQRFKEAIPAARLIMVPEAGHLAQVDSPQIFNSAIRTFAGEIFWSNDKNQT
ncbi:MAG: alpha/beta fold hydrolase [Dehalococcoidia bacterium]